MTPNEMSPRVDSQQLILALFSLLPVPVAVADEEGRIVLANARFSDVFQRVVHISDLHSQEIDIPEEGTFAVQILPLSEDGYRIVYATNVTLQRQLALQVDQLERMASVGRAVIGISEDIQNPLADIAEYSAMADQCRMDSAARRIFEVIVSGADRAGHLVQSLLVAGAGEKTSPESVDLNEIVRSVMLQRGPRHASRNLEVRVALDPNLPKAIGIPAQIEQLIASLVMHAEDAISGHVEHSGWIRVQTGVRDGRVQVQVSDNGNASLTSPSFSADLGGVGLSICGEIAREHGGDLFAWNAHGGGSSLTFELPVLTQQTDDGHDSTTLTRLLQNMTVLVVEDDPQISEFISDVLSRHGAHVQVSASGGEAYDRIFSTEYGLIICNHLMIGLCGENLYHLLKSTSPETNQRFLFLTGDVISPQARRFFTETGVQYLRKPFRIRDLVETVEDLFIRCQPLGF